MAFIGTIPPVPSGVVPAKTTRFNNGIWLFDKPMGTGVGFIYVIRDIILHRFYLGKKSYKVSRGKLKGSESNWRNYKSSSNLLKDMMKERPKEEFEFIVIEEYKTKGTLSYSETWSLCLVEAPTTTEWYNTRIEEVAWSVKEPISDKHKDRLKRVLAWEDFKET